MQEDNKNYSSILVVTLVTLFISVGLIYLIITIKQLNQDKTALEDYLVADAEVDPKTS